jgi:DNA polymerase phi
VGHAAAAQAGFEPPAPPTEPAADAEDKERAVAALATCAPLAAYVVRRLCRGLGSGRDGARQGFATALAHALTAVPAVPLEHVFSLLKDSLEPVTGASKGAEVNDSFFGQLFGLGAIIRALEAREAAAAAPQKKKEAAEAAARTLALRAALAEELVALAAKKSFLAEGAAALLVQLVGAVVKPQLAAFLKAAPTFATWLQADPDSARPEVRAFSHPRRVRGGAQAPCGEKRPRGTSSRGSLTRLPRAAHQVLVVLLKLLPKLPADVVAQCPMLPEGVVANPVALFARSHLEALLPTLKATSAAHPRMHSLWGVLLAALVPGLAVTECGRVLGSGKIKRHAPSKRKAPKGDAKDAQTAKKGKKEPGSEEAAEAEDEDDGASSDDEQGDDEAAAATLFVNPGGLVAVAEAEALWEVVVEQGLIPSSHERKYLAFELFARLLPYLPDTRAAAVFSRGFMQVRGEGLLVSCWRVRGVRACSMRFRRAASRSDPTPRLTVFSRAG